MKTTQSSKGYTVRRANERGFFDHGWLKTYHTFSFGRYYDPNFMGFRSLRVINEDRVNPGNGFPPHDHENMEIVTILLEGELAHKDSMDNERIIHENEIQAMSAGTGVTHSEYNPSNKNSCHFLQIWILPEENGITPRYQQRSLPKKDNEWILLVSKNGENGSLLVNQDIKLYSLNISQPCKIKRELESNRYGWLQLIEGEIDFNGEKLHAGDGVAIDKGTSIQITSTKPSKLLLFDLN